MSFLGYTVRNNLYFIDAMVDLPAGLFHLLLLDGAVGAPAARAVLPLEFLANSIHECSIELLRDGLIVSGKRLRSGVLYAELFGNLSRAADTSRKSPF
jgi:hypothetical protein